jgi:hypothetical protein
MYRKLLLSVCSSFVISSSSPELGAVTGIVYGFGDERLFFGGCDCERDLLVRIAEFVDEANGVQPILASIESECSY